jgi:uncharacterized protein YuzE
MKTKRLFLVWMVLLAMAPSAFAAMATFEEATLAPNSYWGGAGSGETGFTSGDTHFPHNDATYAWDGFVYSNMTDTTTAGHTNQFSAITGGGADGSANYGIGYIPTDYASGTYDPIPQQVSFGAETGEDYNTTISGAYFTNTTFAYLSMRDGDSFAKQFGGESGNDEDYFKLTITGITDTGEYTANSVEFYLADFRFADNEQDYIVDEWTWVDLSSLGNVIGLEFEIESSDVGAYGINTPGYFAMDNLNAVSAVPVPAAVWLLGSGLLGLIGMRRKKHSKLSA